MFIAVDYVQKSLSGRDASSRHGLLTAGCLSVQEQYNSLTNKTVAFLRAVTSHYSPRYIVKADDDVYLRVDRLPYAIKQWTAFNSGTAVSSACIVALGFIVCMHVLWQSNGHLSYLVQNCQRWWLRGLGSPVLPAVHHFCFLALYSRQASTVTFITMLFS